MATATRDDEIKRRKILSIKYYHPKTYDRNSNQYITDYDPQKIKAVLFLSYGVTRLSTNVVKLT